MSAIGDIMAGLKTVMMMTSKVEALTQEVLELNREVRELDRRLVRVETLVEVVGVNSGAILRINPPDKASDPE